MRVLMLAQFYPPDVGGEERHAYNLSRALVARGHEVEVLTTALPAAGAGDTWEDGVLVHRRPSSGQHIPHLYGDPNRPHALPLADPAMQRAVNSLLTDGSFDVVHAHNWIVNSALVPARHTATPLILTLHDYSHVCAVKRMMRFGQVCDGPAPLRCLRCAAAHYGSIPGSTIAAANTWARRTREIGVSAFIAVSRSVAERNGLDRAGVEYDVVANFIPDELLDDPAPDRPDGPLLYLGDLRYDKGVTVLLDAYRLLDAAPPLRLIGRRVPGTDLTLPDGVTLLPPMPHEEAMAEMRSARAVIVPSIVPDSCPTVVLEAMAAGRPVIGSRRGGIVDLVVDQVTGILISPDPATLAATITELVEDDTRARAMGRAGREHAAAYTASSVSAQIERIYLRVLRSVAADSAAS